MYSLPSVLRTVGKSEMQADKIVCLTFPQRAPFRTMHRDMVGVEGGQLGGGIILLRHQIQWQQQLYISCVTLAMSWQKDRENN